MSQYRTMGRIANLRRWTNQHTLRGQAVSIVCSFCMVYSFLPLGGCSTELPGTGDGPAVFDADTIFDAGKLVVSGIPEDTRLGYIIDLDGVTWEYFGTRDSEGNPQEANKVELSKDNTTVTFFMNDDGQVERIERLDADTGDSAAAQLTYLSGGRVRVDAYDAITQDPNSPTDSTIVDIPPSNPGKSKQLGDSAGMNWREVERAALAKAEHQVDMRSELVAFGGTKGASVAAPATPGVNVSATFKTQVRTESGDPVTDATVGFRIGGFEQIKAIRAVGSHSNQGFYQTTVTLNRAGEVTQGVTDCEKMTTIGVAITAVVLAATRVFALAAEAVQGSRLTQILEFVQTVGPKGAPAIVGASYLANQYQLTGICARINDFIGQRANGNLIVTAVILDSQSRPEIIGAESPTGIVPVTPIAVGAQTSWDLEPIVVADPSSGGLSDVAVGKRDVSLTFWDHGVEDGDKVSINLTKTMNGMTETVNVFTGTLTIARSTKQIQLGRGPNTIEVTALNEGDLSPNTASLKISNVVRGSDSQKWGLKEGDKGSFTITAP